MNKQPCRAKDPRTCRTHGTSYIAQDVHAYLTETRSFQVSEEEAYIFTEDIIEVLGWVDNPDAEIENLRDEEAIHDNWKYTHQSDWLKLQFDVKGAIHEIVYLYDDKKTELPENNVLDPDKASTYGGYHVALGKMLADKGVPVDKYESYYAWEDYNIQPHVRSCGIASVSNPHEKEWQEFNGTFNDEDDSMHGVEADAQCNCGYFKGKLRKEASLTDLTRDLLNNYS